MKRIIFIAIINIFYLSSCLLITPKYIQSPNSPNLIQIDKRKDLKASVSYAYTGHTHIDGAGTETKSNGIDAQTAYGISDKFAIKIDAFKKWEIDKDDSKNEAIKNYFIKYKRGGAEMSIGYYTFIGKRKNFIFNIYTGVGIGKNSFDGRYRNDNMINRTYSANHTKWFIMPSITLVGSKNYALLFAYKLSVLKFNNINTNDEALKNGFYTELTNKNSLFGDFVLDNQFGFNKIKGIKFHVMIGGTKLYTYFTDVSSNVNGTSYNSDQYLYNDHFASFGIIADVRQLFAKK